MTQETQFEAPIAEVTVFPDGARVVRRGTVQLDAGSPTAVLADLPATLDPASVRVVARGEGIALRDVEVQRTYRPLPVHEEAARLRADVERCRDDVRTLVDEGAAEQVRLDYFEHLSASAAKAFARAVGAGTVEHAQLARMADELAEGTAAALSRRRKIASRRRAARRELDAAERRLEAVESGGDHSATTLVAVRATLEVEAATGAELEVVYHVVGASWHPLYDLRLQAERLSVEYLAEISQRSGEDWPAVALTLSTARRGHHTELPELSPWYVGRAAPVARRAAFAAARAMPAQFGPMGESDAAGEPLVAGQLAMAAAPAAPLMARPEDSGAALVYRVTSPVPVPSDGAPRKTHVARFELDAALDHLTVPPLAPEAYLRATVTNDSGLMLLPGPANVFHEDEFVGQTRIETVAPGEELELHLGVDDRVRVERELKRRSTSKAILGGTRSVDVAYEVTIENHRAHDARVTVQDHIPVSRDGDVKVRLRECAPKPALQDELGQLTWELQLAPGAEAVVRFAFTVDHPASAQLTGL